MHRTYHVEVRFEQGPGRTQLVTCLPEQIAGRAEEFLDEEGALEVEVREAGAHIFTMSK